MDENEGTGAGEAAQGAADAAQGTADSAQAAEGGGEELREEDVTAEDGLNDDVREGDEGETPGEAA